jgi:hypothetical protein
MMIVPSFISIRIVIAGIQKKSHQLIILGLAKAEKDRGLLTPAHADHASRYKPRVSS